MGVYLYRHYGIFGFLVLCLYLVFWIANTDSSDGQIATDGSVIVGVFSLLVTLLVTWQIYSTIVAKEQVEKLTEKYDNLRAEFLKLGDGSKYLMMGWHRFSMGESSLDSRDYSDAYICYIAALKHYANSNIELNDEIVSQCFGAMDFCLDCVEDIAEKKIKDKFFDKYSEFDTSNNELFVIVNGTDAVSRDFKVGLVRLQRRRNAINGGEEYLPESVSDREFFKTGSKKFLLSKVKEKEAQISSK